MRKPAHIESAAQATNFSTPFKVGGESPDRKVSSPNFKRDSAVTPLTLKPKRIMSKSRATPTEISPVKKTVVIEHIPEPKIKKDRSALIGLKRTRKSRD